MSVLIEILPYRQPLVGELSLYDIVGTEGVAADISHISTAAKVLFPSLNLSYPISVKQDDQVTCHRCQ